MPKIGLPELIVILIVALIIFGPKNLPKLGSALGKTVKNIRDGVDGKDDKKKSKDSDGESSDSDESAESESDSE